LAARTLWGPACTSIGRGRGCIVVILDALRRRAGRVRSVVNVAVSVGCLLLCALGQALGERVGFLARALLRHGDEQLIGSAHTAQPAPVQRDAREEAVLLAVLDDGRDRAGTLHDELVEELAGVAQREAR